MPRIVGVHGVAQQLKGPKTLAKDWFPALSDGVTAAGGKIEEGDLVCAFYGGLFRPSGSVRASGDFAYRASDVSDSAEIELLLMWWATAAANEPNRVMQPGADVRLATPRSVQAALRALSRSSFFSGLAERVLIGSLKQVRRYINEPDIRKAAQASVHHVVTQDTTLLVAHSLGTVVTYEALQHYSDSPNWQNVSTLITMGSPLGVRNLIFDKLQPSPVDGLGQWPKRITRWINISDDGDVVALDKHLNNLFDGDIVDIRIHNLSKAHDVTPYLTAKDTGAAIFDALRGSSHGT